MAYESEIATVWRWGQRIAEWWQAFRARLPSLSERWLLLISAVALGLYAVFLRCLHLLDSAHYYILSPDSNFFHWVARGIMAGEPPPIPPGSGSTYLLHSGLAYPLAYFAKALGFIFGMSPTDALDTACKVLPIIIGLATMIVIFLVASKLFDRTVGLFSAFAWAAMLYAAFVGAAGYLDRDGLSILLIAAGAFIFFFSTGWRFRIRNRDVGWLLAGLGVLGVEGILYAYWNLAGVVLLIVIVMFFSLVRLLIGYTDSLQSQPDTLLRLKASINDTNWRVLAVIVIGNILIMVAAVGLRPEANWGSVVQSYAELVFGESEIAEMAGIRPAALISYYLFYIPIVVAIVIGLMRRVESVIFLSCWFFSMLILSLFSSRMLLYTVPAACLLSGIGLAFIWGWKNRGSYRLAKKGGVAILFFLLVLLAFRSVNLGADPRMAPGEDWQDALSYLREDAPKGSVVMTWWDYGYWILDIAEQKPLVDNGYYGWDKCRLHDVALAYVASDSAQAARIMQSYGARYLVFSSLDLDITEHVLRHAETTNGDDQGLTAFPRASLVSRCLNEDFDSENGLSLVYRSEPNGDVVILELASVGVH